MATINDLKELFADGSPVSVALEINGFTGFRTTSLEELTADEINRLFEIHRPKPKDLDAEFNAFKIEVIRKAWKSKIIALAEKVHVKELGSEHYHQFNNWMLTRSKFKKHLEAHSIDEMKQLHQQLHALQDNNRRSAQNPMTEAWWKKGAAIKNCN